MTGSDILQDIWKKLGSNTTFYPEAEVIVNGINPAMRLLCLMKPDLLNQRVAVTLVAETSLIDLREQAPRSWILRRVMLGTMTGDAPSKTAYGELKPLLRTSIEKISWQRDWFSKRGTPEAYYQHGRDWIGIYKRPTADRALTLIYRAIPTAFTTNTMSDSPAFAEVWHPLIADIATALLLIKEGETQTAKARQMLTVALGKELFGARTQRANAADQQAPTPVPTQVRPQEEAQVVA